MNTRIPFGLLNCWILCRGRYKKERTADEGDSEQGGEKTVQSANIFYRAPYQKPRRLLNVQMLTRPMADSTLFPDLPDEARCWVYTSAAPLSASTQEALSEQVRSFLEDWSSHNRPVRGAATVLYDRFLVLAATLEGDGDISGCGIDASTHAIDEAADTLGVEWAPSLHVVYRTSDGTVEAVSRSTFRTQVEEGTVTASTVVFDPSVTTLGEVRSGEFEQPAGESWHARIFRIPEPA